MRGVLLRPLPFPDAAQVVRLWPANPTTGLNDETVSVTELEDWERELRSFAAVGGFRTFGGGAVLGDRSDPVYTQTAYVTRGFFPALGTAAMLGRTLLPEEHVPGPGQVVVSHAFWRRYLGEDPAVRVVAAGDALLAPAVTRRLIEEFARRPGAPVPVEGLEDLTDREREVLVLMARGSSNAEIAASLFVAETTVKTHVGRVLHKLRLRDRAQAVVVAYESGLVRPGS